MPAKLKGWAQTSLFIIGCMLLGAALRTVPFYIARWLLPLDAQPSAVVVLSMILMLGTVTWLARRANS